MMTIKANDIQTRFKEICDKVVNGEVFIVARPKNRNVVVISEEEYNALARARKNTEFLAKLDRGEQAIANGKGVTYTIAELEEMTK